MGVTYYSEAVVITTEPDKIIDLINQVYDSESNQQNLFSTLCDLKVEENAVTFNSCGYGVFGLNEHWITNGEELLFRYLFNNFDGPLVCHEAIRSCHDFEAFYSATWVKDCGEADFDEEDCVCMQAAGKSLDDDPDFGGYWVWSTCLGDAWITPSAKQLIETARAKGFKDWATEEEFQECIRTTDESITIDTIWKIAEEYPELEDLASDAVNEAENMMFDFNKLIEHSEGHPEELEDLVKKHNDSIEKSLAHTVD